MKKILIVDDDKDIRDSLEALLSGKYEVKQAANKSEALAFIDAREFPDLVLLDVKMENDQDGFEFIEEIEKRPEIQKFPIVLVTGIDVVNSSYAAADIVRGMREKFQYYNANVLVMRASTGEVFVEYKSKKTSKTILLNVNGFVGKPVENGKLMREISRVLE